jgi:hypothetical protein
MFGAAQKVAAIPHFSKRLSLANEKIVDEIGAFRANMRNGTSGVTSSTAFVTFTSLAECAIVTQVVFLGFELCRRKYLFSIIC